MTAITSPPGAVSVEHAVSPGTSVLADPQETPTEDLAGPSQPPKDVAARPSTPPVPASESHEIMSEGHSDWEKVEKPLQSPPKGKAAKAGVAKKDDKDGVKEGGFKGKVGEVKRVFKSGMFGHSPKASPTTATTTKPYVPARAASVRASLGPARKVAVPPPPSGKSVTSTPATTAARSAASAATASVPKPANTAPLRSKVSTLAKPSSSETIKGTTASVARSGSLSTKPAVAGSTTGARITKPTLPSIPSGAKTAARAGGVSPAESTGSAATATAFAVARKRVSLGPTKTTATAKTTPTVRAPLTTSTSNKPAARQVSGGQAEALAGLAKAKEEKEVSERELIASKNKVEELEAALMSAQASIDEKLSEQARTRAKLEDGHSRAIEEVRTQHAAERAKLTDTTNAEFETKITELKEVHANELAESDEQREAQAQQVEQQIADLTQAVQSVSQQHTDALQQLQSAQEKLDHYQAAHTEAEERAVALQRQLEKMTEEHQAHEGIRQDLSARLESAMKEKEGLEREFKEGEEEAERSHVDLGGMRGRVEELEEEVRELKGVMAGKSAEVERVRESMSRELEALQKEFSESNGKVAGLSLALSKAEEAVKSHGDELKAITDERDALLVRIRDLEISASVHDTEVQRLRAELAEVEAEQDKLVQLDLDSTAEIELLRETIAAADKRAKAGEDSMEVAQGKNKEMEDKVVALEAELEGAKGDKEKLAERIQALENDIEEKEEEYKTNYDSQLETAKSEAYAHHAAELSAIRLQLTDTHSQLQAAHSAELESTAANHAAQLSSITADHASELAELKTSVQKLEDELNRAMQADDASKNQVDALLGRLAQAEEEFSALKKELDGKKNGDVELEKKLEVALKELAGVRDELEGTKEVLEMNKSHFQLSLEEMQGQHTRELHESAAERAGEDAKRESMLQVEKEKLRSEVERLEKEMKDREAAAKIANIKAAQGMMSKIEVDEKIENLEAEHQEEVSRLETWIEQLQAQLLAATKTPTPSAPAAAPKVLEPIIVPHPELVSTTTTQISSPVRGTTFQAPETPSPKRSSTIDGASPASTPSAGLKAEVTPSKVPTPASPAVSGGLAKSAPGVEDEEDEEDMDVEGESDRDVLSSVESLKAVSVPV